MQWAENHPNSETHDRQKKESGSAATINARVCHFCERQHGAKDCRNYNHYAAVCKSSKAKANRNTLHADREDTEETTEEEQLELYIDSIYRKMIGKAMLSTTKSQI